MKQNKALWITPIVFLVLIFGVAILNLSTPDRDFSESENRPLEQRPSFSWDALFSGEFTTNVDTWLTDQFPFRDGFIGVKTGTEYAAGKRDTNGVYFAQDGYLIEKHDQSSVDMPKLQKNVGELSGFVNREAQRLGTDHVKVMIAPTAGTVLRGKLPAFAASQEFDQAAFFEQLRKTLPEGTWIDLLPTFENAAGSNVDLYYKTDHHWTTTGAYLAYREWCEAVGVQGLDQSVFDKKTVTESFYGTIYSKARLSSTKPDKIEAWNPKSGELDCTIDYNLGQKSLDSLYDESYLDKKDKYSYFIGGNNAVATIHTSVHNGKTLLLIKDSYAHSLAPFLANEFETIHLIDLRYFNMPLSQFIEQNPVTDVLVMYNAVTFSDDLGVLKINK